MVEKYKHNKYNILMRKFCIFKKRCKCVSFLVHYTTVTWNNTTVYGWGGDIVSKQLS